MQSGSDMVLPPLQLNTILGDDAFSRPQGVLAISLLGVSEGMFGMSFLLLRLSCFMQLS